MKKFLKIALLSTLLLIGVSNATLQKFSDGESWYITTRNDGITITKNRSGFRKTNPQYPLDVNGTANATTYLGDFRGTVSVVVPTANYSLTGNYSFFSGTANIAITANYALSFPNNVVTDNYQSGITINGVVSANSYYGDGSNLTGISGSGGGSGLEMIELKSQIEKLGITYPLSNQAYSNYSFTNQTIFLVTLNEDYATSAPTINISNISGYPIYPPLRAVIINSANIDFININSLNTGTIYNCDGVARAYTKASSNITLEMMSVGNSQGIFNPRYLVGEAATTNYSINRVLFPATQNAKTLDYSQRWWDKSLTINTFTTNNIKAIAYSDETSYLKAGDRLILFQNSYVDTGYQSGYNDKLASGNFEMYTVSEDPIYSPSPNYLLSITVNTTINATITANYALTRYSVIPMYAVHSSTTVSALAEMPFTSFIYGPTKTSIFYDNYNRANGLLTSPYEYVVNASNDGGNTPLQIVTNELYNNAVGYGSGNQRTMYTLIRRNAERFSVYPVRISFKYKISHNNDNTGSSTLWVAYNSGGGYTANAQPNTGIVLRLAKKAGGPTNRTATIYRDTAALVESGNVFTEAVYYMGELLIFPNSVEFRTWIAATGSRPTAATISSAYSPLNTPQNTYFDLGAEGASYLSVVSSVWLDDLSIDYLGNGYLTRGTLPNQTGNSIDIASKMTRNSAVSQNPTVFERNAILR